MNDKERQNIIDSVLKELESEQKKNHLLEFLNTKDSNKFIRAGLVYSEEPYTDSDKMEYSVSLFSINNETNTFAYHTINVDSLLHAFNDVLEKFNYDYPNYKPLKSIKDLLDENNKYNFKISLN